MGYFLGQADDKPSISFSSDGRTMTWFAPASLPDPIQLFVIERGIPKLHVEGRGGVAPVDFIILGVSRLRWDMVSNDVVVLSVEVDATSGRVKQWVSYTAPTGIASQGPPPVSPPEPPPPVSGKSWFEGTTNLFGYDVPNLYLLASGGGFLLLAVVKGKK